MENFNNSNMRDLSTEELSTINGGELSPNEGATLILALGAAGTAATLGFAIPIAAALYYVSQE